MKSFRWRSLLDSGLYLALASGLNIFWFSYNPGFRDWVWHPYLFLIALIGLFYGLWEALVCAAACNLVYAASLAAAGYPITTLWQAGPDARNVLVFLVSGLIFGEIGELYQRNVSGARESSDKNAKNLTELEIRHRALSAAHQQLLEDVKYQNSPWGDLERVSDRLFSLQISDIQEAALELCQRLIGAQSCAFYQWDETRKQFFRRSSLGNLSGTPNPQQVSWDSLPFRQLQAKGPVLSVRDVETIGAGFHWFAAAPLTVQDKIAGVLVIESLPLGRLTEKTLQTLGSLSGIVSRAWESALKAKPVARTTSAPQGAVYQDEFQAKLEQEKERSRRHAIPFSLLQFKIDRFEEYEKSLGTLPTQAALEKLVTTLNRNKRAGDLLTYQGQGSFALLLPHTETEHTEAFITRIQDEAAKALTERQSNGNGLNLSLSFVKTHATDL